MMYTMYANIIGDVKLNRSHVYSAWFGSVTSGAVVQWRLLLTLNQEANLVLSQDVSLYITPVHTAI